MRFRKTKECSHCGITKHIEEFGPSKHAKDKKNPWCRICCNKALKKTRQASQRHRQKRMADKVATFGSRNADNEKDVLAYIDMQLSRYGPRRAQEAITIAKVRYPNMISKLIAREKKTKEMLLAKQIQEQ